MHVMCFNKNTMREPCASFRVPAAMRSRTRKGKAFTDSVARGGASAPVNVFFQFIRGQVIDPHAAL